jgi:hypothetical protein
VATFPIPEETSMSRKQLLLLTLLLTLAVPSRAFAQGAGAGSIDGFVTDQAGNPLRGVKIVAESAAQIGKGRSTYTTAEGTFHLGALTPGIFRITATSPGLQSVVQDNIVVGITSPADVNVMMEVATAEATAVIIEKRTPVISTTKAAVQQSFEAKVVQAIPFRDTVNQFRDILHSSPGTINLRVRGGAAGQTQFLEDGFEIRDIFPPIRSAQAFEVQTAAYGADAPTAAGGVTNMVTRSGSNDFQFEFLALNVGSWGERFKDNLDTTAGLNRWVINPTVSGPILKDKLWYHVNVELTASKIPNPRDPLLVLPEPSPQFSVFPKAVAKLSWQATPRNKIDLLFNGDTPYGENNRTAPGIADSAQQDRLAQRYFLGLTWESLLTDKLLFRSQAGWIGFFQNVYPANCRTGDPNTCYDIPNVRQTLPTALEFQNSPNHMVQDKQSLQFINSLEYFLSTARFGEHKLRLRDFVLVDRDEQKTSINGNFQFENIGAVPGFRTEFWANDPRLEAPRYGAFGGTTRSLKHVLTLSDTWKPVRRLTAIAALSYVQARGSNSVGTFPYKASTFAPGLSLVWDVGGDGRNVLRTSGSVYVDVDLTNISRFAMGTQVSQRCAWNPTTQQYDTNCTYSGGAANSTIGDLKTPKTWEATLGGAHELQKGTALSLDFVYRQFTHQYEDYEVNRIWNESGTGLLGTANGQPATVLNLDTLTGARRRWMGATLALTKTEGDLLMQGSYTLSRLDGTVLDGFQNFYGTIPSQDRILNGPLDDDHRHEIKLVMYWQIKPWLSTGVRYTYYSGLPRKRLFFNNVTGTYNLYRALPGIDPGVDRNNPLDDFPIRTPDQQDLNVEVRVQLLPVIGHDVSFFAHVLNTFALRTPLTFGTADGRDYGVVLTRMEPFRIRVGVEYAWGGPDRTTSSMKEMQRRLR